MANDPPALLHLLKMAVGVASLDELREVRARRIAQLGGSWVYTRNRPRRAEAVLSGGSLYWVIRGQIRVRQRLTGFDAKRDDKGRPYCLIAVDPELVPTVPRAWRPFQGWRYLSPADAPPDLSAGALLHTGEAAGDAPLPARLVAELRALGLL
ncbi:MAG: DUF1489 family protein [Thiohalocapsa sp.]